MKKHIYILGFLLLVFASCKNGVSGNAKLKELQVKNFVLSPAFNPNNTDYVAVSENLEYKTQVTAYPEDENATVDIQYSGNKINIVVMATDRKTTKKYVVMLKQIPLYDLGLTSLSLFSNNEEIPFTEEFSKQKTNYEALIPFSLNTQLEVIYKINYPSSKIEIKKEPQILEATVGSKQMITIDITEPKYSLSKKYTIKCIRQSLDGNTNIESIDVLNKKAVYIGGEFHSSVPFKTSQAEIEKNIIVTTESSVAKVSIKELAPTPFLNAEGAKKKYIITVKAEDTSKTKDYTLVLTRNKPIELNVESVSVKGIEAIKKTDGSFFLFLPKNIEATKIENDIKLTFENGEEYSYTIKAINQKPLGLSPLSFKEFQALIFLGDEVSTVDLTMFRDLNEEKDRDIVEVIKEELSFTGKTPSWLEAENPDYRDLLGVFREGEAVSIKPFSIGKYEVTYELWKGVYNWAREHGYYFENKGKCGSSNSGDIRQPVSDISWRDVIVWCNAYSEMLGKEAYYYSDLDCKKPIKTSITDYDNNEKYIKDAGSIDMPYMKRESNGFRLPFSNEWELASRGGDPTNDLHWNFKYAGSNDLEEVAVFFPSEAKNKITSVVGSKLGNRLELYDMSGNVFELCADTLSDGTNFYKALRGGAFYSQPVSTCVTFTGITDSWKHYINIGFRLATSKK